MADQSRNLLLTATTVLVIISFGKVALGQCPNSLENIVVYEGTKDTILSSCGLRSGRWTVRPTSKVATEFDITNSNGTVYPTLTGLYAFNQSGLIIRIATSNNTDGPISTAGMYSVYLPDGNKTAIKVAVIRSGPNCSLTRTSSEGANITCTIIYADSPAAPINAVFRCTADGRNYTATPSKMLITPYLYNSTATLFINSSSAAYSYCRVTFTAPELLTAYLARNEPKFIANVTVVLGQCLNSLENIVVYEGTKDTILSSCGLRSGRWTVRPTSKANKEVDITNSNGTVNQTLTGLYAFNESGLIIRIATSNNTDGPISTAGVYFVYLPDNNLTAAAAVKVVVIRSGPNWSLTRTSSEGASITCTIIYADHPVSPMNAIISCTADGRNYTAIPPRMFIPPYVWSSTATLTFNSSSAAAGGAAYNCRATFTAPADNITSYLARNDPKFIAKVTVVN